MKSIVRTMAGALFGAEISDQTVALLILASFAFSTRAIAQEVGSESRKPIPAAEELKKLPSDGGPDYNRLVFEKSPYLLQHAGNPVDWYPWGDAAFDRAKAEDKPIFLSVGYSTCHWCHVMEKESFEDKEVAALLNESFISIKVDREERPDIDQIYMKVTQAMTGSGGWPMTVMMSPDKRPFFAGTYFPKNGRQGMPGLVELLPAVAAAWKDKRQQLIELAGEIHDHLRETTNRTQGEKLGLPALIAAYEALSHQFDDELGGFAPQPRLAPKFPSPHTLTFLLRFWRRTGEAHALEMVEKTLAEMRRGGIFDQVGLGFHRYSTDREWLVPHFEKMIYDQAMIVMACVETYQATGKEEYAAIARDVLTYVLRDMTSPEGGFYSAEDADSEGVEGKFYLWSAAEIRDALGKEDAGLFLKTYGFADDGNYIEMPAGHKTSVNILHLTGPIADAEIRAKMNAAREKLFSIREKRVHPAKDDKILTDWNGLMIAALAQAGRTLGEPKYTDAARKSADFILAKMRVNGDRLLHRYRQGDAALAGHVDDYAFLVWGLIELYETTFDAAYLKSALELNDSMLAHFWDDESGGLFSTANDAEKLLLRPKEAFDSATPSGNSVAALNLIRLSRLTGKTEYETKAVAIGKAFASDVARAPSGFTQMLCATDFSLGPAFEIVIAGKPNAPDTEAMLKPLREKFIPNKVVIFRPDGDSPRIVKLATYTEFQTARDGKATAYVCQNFTCQAPTTEIEVMVRAIERQPMR